MTDPTLAPDVWNERFGDEPITIHHLEDMQIAMLEERSNLHQITLDRWYDMKNRDKSKFKEYDVLESLIVDRVAEWHKLIYSLRLNYQQMVLSSQSALDEEMARCRDDVVWFINVWCWAQEPRNTRLKTSKGSKMPAMIPLVLYPGQRRVIEEIESCYNFSIDFIIAKSREAGISWGAMAWVLHKWLFIDEFRAGVASETADKVDILGTVNPLFGKIRYMLYNLPNAMRPLAYRDNKEQGKSGKNNKSDNLRRLINQDNGAEILGETGDTAGEGGRYSFYIFDEEQNQTQPEKIDSSLQSATDCRGAIGTSKGMNHFGRKWHSDEAYKISVMWHEDPRKVGKHWSKYDKELGVFDREPYFAAPWRVLLEIQNAAKPEVIAMSYDMDWQASVSDLCIEPRWIQSCVGFEFPESTGSYRQAGLDIAGQGADNSVYIDRVGWKVNAPRDLTHKEVTENVMGGHTIAKAERVSAMVYDQNTIGEFVYGMLTKIEKEIPYELVGIHGQSSPSDRLVEGEGQAAKDFFSNKRTELWWNLRRRIRNTFNHANGIMEFAAEDMISLPNHPKLLEELAYPKLFTKSGKWALESKDEMKKRGLHSPDYGDALAYCGYDETVGIAKALPNFSRSSVNKHFAEIDISNMAGTWKYTVGLYRNKGNELLSVMVRWSIATKKLQIVSEYKTPTFDFKSHKDHHTLLLSEAMSDSIIWVVQERVMEDRRNKRPQEYQEYRVNKIKPRYNYGEDFRGTMLMLDRLFGIGGASIHNACKKLVSDIMVFDVSSASLQDRYGRILALLLAVQYVDSKNGRMITKISSAHKQGYKTIGGVSSSSVLSRLLD